MIYFVSLGMSCQTTHRITDFTTQNPGTAAMAKSPFDWVISPPDSTANWLNENLCEFKLADLTEHREHAYWPRFNLWLWHGFLDRRTSSPTLNLAQFFEQELSKLKYLKGQFNSLDISQTRFIVSNTQNNLSTEVFDPDEDQRYRFSEENIDKLQFALDRFFGKPVDLQVITRLDRCTADLVHRENVHLLTTDESNWKGDKMQWDALLTKLAD